MITPAPASRETKYSAVRNDGPGFDKFEEWTEPRIPEPRRQVFRGGNGPPVVLLHEITGATPQLFRFAYRVAESGFTVYVPILFGEPNREGTGLYALSQMVRVCLSREFAVFSAHASSPITDWIRSLGRLINGAHGGGGIGAIGLCLTGNFTLTMMLDEHLLAPVVSEPALPFVLTADGRAALHLSAAEIGAIRERVQGGAEILAFRFDRDWISPESRYDNLMAAFSPNVQGNGKIPPTCPGAHAVFTNAFDQSAGSSTVQALSDLIEFLSRKLK